jgi:hypothetical protein
VPGRSNPALRRLETVQLTTPRPSPTTLVYRIYEMGREALHGSMPLSMGVLPRGRAVAGILRLGVRGFEMVDGPGAFEGSLLRLREAAAQKKRFDDSWNRHLSSVPWEFSLESDGPLKHRLMGREIRTVPAQLGLHFSIWLQQLRAALDNALYACVGSRQCQFPPLKDNLIEFPITESRTKFNSTKTIKNQAVDEDVAVFLEGQQPYWRGINNEQDAKMSHLYWLNELARIDRHRVMHVSVGSIHISQNFRLVGGVHRKVVQNVEPGHILGPTSCLLTFETERPLYSKDLAFTTRPQILPEIPEWSSAESYKLQTHLWEEKEPDDRYLPERILLPDRMAGTMNLVHEIVLILASKAGYSANDFRELMPDWISTYQETPQQRKYWAAEEVRRRKTNGF